MTGHVSSRLACAGPLASARPRENTPIHILIFSLDKTKISFSGSLVSEIRIRIWIRFISCWPIHLKNSDIQILIWIMPKMHEHYWSTLNACKFSHKCKTARQKFISTYGWQQDNLLAKTNTEFHIKTRRRILEVEYKIFQIFMRRIYGTWIGPVHTVFTMISDTFTRGQKRWTNTICMRGMYNNDSVVVGLLGSFCRYSQQYT